MDSLHPMRGAPWSAIFPFLHKKSDYRPLPENTTILKSNIEGLGLFATEDIDKNKTLGVSHVKHHDYLNGFIRTPLGGFINHQGVEKKLIDNELVEVSGPNCEKMKHRPQGNKTEWNLITRRDIKAGEELTLHYTFYKPE